MIEKCRHDWLIVKVMDKQTLRCDICGKYKDPQYQPKFIVQKEHQDCIKCDHPLVNHAHVCLEANCDCGADFWEDQLQ